jgi:NADH-quinone oxidoreductase subunit G
MTAPITVHEPKPPDDPDTPFVFSMEGHFGGPPSPLIPLFWAPGWNSAQATNKFQSEIGGPLHGGDPGIRLFEPPQERTLAYFSDIPAPFLPRQGAWLLVPLYHIFGTEELSALSPAVAERVPRAYLALHHEDAAALHVGPDDELECTVAGTIYRLPVKTDMDLPRGLAGLPVGLPGLHGIELPVWCTLSRIDRS